MTQLGPRPTFQPLQYMLIYDTVLAGGHGSAQTLRLHCSSGGMADELIGLYVVADEKKGLRDARCIPPQPRLSSSQRIHMDGLYSSLCPHTSRAPVGIHFPCNNESCITPTSNTAACSTSLYYYCHLRGQIWPCWPSDLSVAHVPWERIATTPTIHSDVCVPEPSDISACILNIL